MPDSRSRPSSRVAQYAPAPQPAPAVHQKPPLKPGTVSTSQPPPPQKKSKTSSIFHIFSRPNVERAKGHSEHAPLPPVALPPPDVLLERPTTRMSTRSRPSSRLSFTSRAASPPRENGERPSSRLSFRFLGGGGGGGSSSSAAPKTNTQPSRSRSEQPWDPPPLFQAYPQAVKHTLLKTPGPAFDASRPAQGYEHRPADPKSSRGSIFGRPMSRQGMRSDNAKTTEKWSKKVYVLIKSGHLLEYAGDGAYDRLPEKVLKLGPDSAAFASDLIPGFPYVLQVLQAAGPGIQVVQMPQKTLRSRFGLTSSSSRRVTDNVLLVFDEPEHMDSWMIAIRREIEALGGKKCRPDSTDQRPADLSLESPSAVQRYEVMQRSSSHRNAHLRSKKPSVATGTQLPVISEGANVPTMNGHPPESRETSTSSAEREHQSPSETTPTDERPTLSDNWFTDLAPPTANGVRVSKDSRRSTDTYEPRVSDVSLKHQAQEPATRAPSVAASTRSRRSNFSTPRYSLSPLAYAQNGSAVTSERPSLTLQSNPHTDPLGLGLNDYSDASTNSYTEASDASSHPSTRTSVTTNQSNGQPTTPRQNQHSPRVATIFRNGTTTVTPIMTSAFHNRTNPSSPIAESVSSPRLSSRSPSPPNVLRRPPSISIHSDPVPFLSAMAKSRTTTSTPRAHQQRTTASVLVPVVRPPSIKTNKRQYVVPGTPGSRPGSALEILVETTASSRDVAAAHGFLNLPPQMPPPTSPLPVPPGIAV